MRLQEEELAGKEGETPIPSRQGPAFGIVIKRLGGGFSVDENNPVRPANTVAAARNNALEKRHTGVHQAMRGEEVFERLEEPWQVIADWIRQGRRSKKKCCDHEDSSKRADRISAHRRSTFVCSPPTK